MNSLSLDDQKKLALAAGYEDARIAIDVDNNVNKDRHSFVVVDKVNIFSPKSTDSLMRLMEKLSIGIKPIRYGYKAQHYILPHVIREKHTAEAEEIADAIIKCSLQIIKECGE